MSSVVPDPASSARSSIGAPEGHGQVECVGDVRQSAVAGTQGTDGILDPVFAERRGALLEEAPESGFLGGDPDNTGSVEFITDDAEHVVLRVRAEQRGFLFLADEFSPGWKAAQMA